jgi:hypothetical protein
MFEVGQESQGLFLIACSYGFFNFISHARQVFHQIISRLIRARRFVLSNFD